jgi:Sulfotransferase family
VKARREIVRSLAGWRSRRSAVRRASKAPPPAPFVVGATRSGTTLLRLMLDAHPGMAIPSETHFIPELISAREKHGAGPEQMLELLTSHRRWGDFTIEPAELAARWASLEVLSGPEAVRAFFALYADKQGNPGARWGDKTPGYIKSMREIQTYLPEARFIHLIRDGRDVALSVLKQDWGPQTVEAAAGKWRSRVLRGRAQQPYLGFYIEVKFEDLVLHTERELRRICEFIDLDFDPNMLGYHETAEQRLQEKARALPRAHGEPQSAEKRLMSHAKTFEPPNPDLIGTWRERMSGADQAAYEALAGDLLADLGYELDAPPDGEVYTPRRGPRLPRPLRRAVAVAKQAAGVSDPAGPRTPAPFLIGAARSGTDLLAAMLGAHPDLEMLSETGFVPGLAEMIRSEPMTVERAIKVMAAAGPIEEHGVSEAEMRRLLTDLDEMKAAAVLRAFYEASAASGGKARWGDNTPSYLKRMRRIQRALTEARFIHVVRDGRDTLAAKPAAISTGAAIATGQRWSKKVRSAQQQEHLMDWFLEIRYEDLIADPEAVVRRVCEFIELPFEASMIEPPERSAIEAELGPVGCWRERLELEQLGAFEEVAGEMLDELGYRSGAASAVR